MQTQLNTQTMLELDANGIEVSFDSDVHAIATQHIDHLMDVLAACDDQWDELTELNYYNGYYIDYLARLLEGKRPKFILSEYSQPAGYGYCINGEYDVCMNENKIIVFRGNGDEFESIEIALGGAWFKYRFQIGNTLGVWYRLIDTNDYKAVTTFLHPAIFTKILEFVN